MRITRAVVKLLLNFWNGVPSAKLWENTLMDYTTELDVRLFTTTYQDIGFTFSEAEDHAEEFCEDWDTAIEIIYNGQRLKHE